MVGMLGLFSRRNVVLGLGGATAVGAANYSSHSAEYFAQIFRPRSRNGRDVPLRTASYEDWSAQVGSNFTTHTGHVLKLADVQGFPDHDDRPANLRDRAFVARFDVTEGDALPEALYRVAHPDGGTFDIALSRGGPDKPLRVLAVFG